MHKPATWLTSVRAVEAVQCGQRAAKGDFEDRAGPVGPSREGRAVQVSVAALCQPGLRLVSVGTAGLRAKGVQDGYGSPSRDFEDCSNIGGSAHKSRTVQIAISRLQQCWEWLASIVRMPRESMKGG